VATWNEQLQDEIIQRQTDLMRLASAKGAELIAILDETDAAIKALLLDIDSAGGVTADQFAAIRAVQQRIAEIRAEAWGQIELQLQRDAEEIAIVAADGSRAAVIAATSGEIVPAVVSGQALLSIAATRPFEGRLLSEWAAKMRDDDISRLSKAIQLGMVRGQNPVQIAKDIYEAGGVADISRNGLAALVRTATNHIGNEAAALFAAQNPYIKRERYAATLDARTTLVCAGLDGQVFDVGEGPRPPLHYQCRSTRVPFIDAAYLGQRPAVDATQAGARRAYRGRRACWRVRQVPQKVFPRTNRANPSRDHIPAMAIEAQRADAGRYPWPDAWQAVPGRRAEDRPIHRRKRAHPDARRAAQTTRRRIPAREHRLRRIT